MGTLVSPTLGGLVKNVRNMLGQPDPSNSRWTDEDLVSYINEGIRLYMAEVTFNNEGQFTSQVDLNLVAGQDTVDLPADFFEVRAVYRKVSDGYQIMPYLNNVTRGYLTDNNGSGDAYVPSYYFRNNSLVLREPPNTSEVGGIRLEYIGFPETLINGGDRLTSSISPIFKQVIEMYGVKKAKIQESLVNGSDVGASMAGQHFNELYSQFKEVIKHRSKYPQFVAPYSPEGSS